MPVKLSTTVRKIALLPNATNAVLISEFHRYMKNNGTSESHQNNCLKTNMAFAIFLGQNVTFYDIRSRQQITQFLDTKIKGTDVDPDKKWITTWNDYLNDIKCFLRWLFNEKVRKKPKGMRIAYQSRIGKLLLSLESRQRRAKEPVHIWRQNCGNVMTYY